MLATEGLLDNAGSTFMTNALIPTAESKKIEAVECRPQRGLTIDVRSIVLLFAIISDLYRSAKRPEILSFSPDSARWRSSVSIASTFSGVMLR